MVEAGGCIGWERLRKVPAREKALNEAFCLTYALPRFKNVSSKSSNFNHFCKPLPGHRFLVAGRTNLRLLAVLLPPVLHTPFGRAGMIFGENNGMNDIDTNIARRNRWGQSWPDPCQCARGSGGQRRR